MTPLDSYIEHEDGIIRLGAYRSLLGLLPFDLKKKKKEWTRGQIGLRVRGLYSLEAMRSITTSGYTKRHDYLPKSWSHLIRTRFLHWHLKICWTNELYPNVSLKADNVVLDSSVV